MSHRDTHAPLTPAPLAPGNGALGWVASRCLQAPPHPLACTRCADACPVAALAFQEDGDGGVALQASDACHGCGQCVPACPSEALVSAEIDTLLTGQAQGESLNLACHRAQEASERVRLHCLRALGPDLLAWLAARAAPAALTLTLPEGCRDCPAAPADGKDRWREHAQELATVGEVPADRDFRAARAAVSRRDLLRGRPAPRLPTIAAEDAAPRARRPARQRAAAEALGKPQAAPAMPGLGLALDACRAHGVCARVCPTEALQESREGELAFTPEACLDCGHCLSACPEGALEASPTSDGAAVTLRQARRIACFQCGRPFMPTGDDSARDGTESTTTCPACRRESALMQESFDDLFG
ncbi:Polyferredoxin protein vhuB [Halomonas sp. A3H3]|uniref:4Fe-4S dicluster domain-containing protein n=1 Tax=Halomonas sp. A3H3 TaxID=1346287 RepID=UPI00038D32DA|nr:4Fe-4S dicluster domain-containing protein [Halomonas sp. A3H3]CDG56109.1 Polyferredoxin protein vhuB [Halomonas sp. A3H3]